MAFKLPSSSSFPQIHPQPFPFTHPGFASPCVNAGAAITNTPSHNNPHANRLDFIAKSLDNRP